MKRYGQFCCGTRSRIHTRGQRAVHAWWWGGGTDVVHERGSGGIGILVVLRRHTWSQRHTCGHRAAVHGERWERYTWPHTHGEGCTRRASGRSEQRAADASKSIGVFCGYALVAGLSRGYTCIRGQGVAHAAVGFACSALREGTALAVARRLDFVGRARPTHVFERPAEALARGGGVAGRWQQQQHAAGVEQALANG